MMRAIRLLLILLSTLPLKAEQIGQSRTNEANLPNAQAGEYSAYLGCMNRMRPPIARGLTLNPNTWEGVGPGPDLDPVLLYDRNNKGLHYVTSHVATYDIPKLHEPGGSHLPYYRLSFRRSDGGESVINYFFKDGLPDSASTTGHPEYVRKWRAAANEETFTEIGLPQSRFSDYGRVKKAFVQDLLPRFASMKQSQDWAKNDRRFADSYQRFMSKAKEAFCACAKTKEPQIIEAILNTTKELGMDEKEYKNCLGETLVSRNATTKWTFLLSIAEASEAPIEVFARIETREIESMNVTSTGLVTCRANNGTKYDFEKGQAQSDPCLPRPALADCIMVAEDAKGCVKDGERIAGITGAGVVVVNMKTKRRQIIPDSNAQNLAISGTWLASTNGTTVSIFKLR